MPPLVRTSVQRRTYFALSRAPRYSLPFALPLLLGYEALAVLLSGPRGGVRNGADVILQVAATAVAGRDGPMVLIGAVILVGVVLVWRDVRASRDTLRMSVFLRMLAESALLAIAFGVVVGTVTARLLGSLSALAISPVAQTSTATRLMLSLGAGLYEELFFRVILVSALAAFARVVFGTGTRASGVFATVVGALLFSTAHYIGTYGDHFTLQSFAFRAIGGIAFSALYLTRGFGITAWTHALYDAFLLLV